MLEEHVPGARRLFILFGGIAAGMGVPPFEFYRSAQVLTDSRLFIRDFHRAWYHRGLPGISTNIEGTADYLAGRIKDGGYDDVVFCGNCMGGFAAILFARLLRTGRVVVFSPQGFIDPWLRLKCGDFRWLARMVSIWRHADGERRYFDLNKIDTGGVTVPVRVHAGVRDRLDIAHARHLAISPEVRVFTENANGRTLVKTLRDEGRLAEILGHS